jgi:NADH dehydrogenase, FAD-containing subunit
MPARAERGGVAAARLPLGAGVRDDCKISFVIPFEIPIPPSPDTSRALLEAFAERDIEFLSGHRVSSLDPARSVAVLDDGTELPYDLFLGVPKHRAPEVVVASGMTEDGYVPVSSRTLETRFPGVYALGDVATVGGAEGGSLLREAGGRCRQGADLEAARRR